jgi:hypothetical protein
VAASMLQLSAGSGGLGLPLRRACAAAGVLVFLCSSSGNAQRLSGRVVEREGDVRIAEVQVSLLDESGNAVRSTWTDTAGYFVLEARRPGTHRLTAVRYGYAKYTSEAFRIDAGETVTVVVRLSPEGIPLEPLEVRARGGDERGRDGFERRRALGRGYFLTLDSIWARRPALASDALHAVPGVVVFDGMGTVSVYPLGGGKCFIMYVDHWPVGRMAGSMPDMRKPLGWSDRDQGPINNLKVEWIRGIEIYRNLFEVPQELRTASRMLDLWGTPGSTRAPGGRWRGEPCGMIWVWTNIGW